jgi:hypothetical membrane protein
MHEVDDAGVQRRAPAIAGLVGPVAFVSAWALGAVRTAGYSSVETAISRLAAIGAPTRGLMTGGFVAFGVCLPVYAVALRQRVAGPAWKTAAATGLATLGVAAFPLGRSSTVDVVHGAFATAGYVTLAATPLLAAPALRRAGHRRMASVSTAVGVTCVLSLAATVLGPHHGFFQRAGLTAGDLWIAGSAAAMLISSNARLGASRI